MERKRGQFRTALQTEDKELRNKIEAELIRLKNRKPELFEITEQEQLEQIKAQLATSILQWLIK